MINMKLAKSRGLSDQTIQKIKDIHAERHKYYQSVPAPQNEADAQVVLTLCHDMECQLQSLWGFPESMSMHRFWEFPHCSCPKIDNEERYGTNTGYVHNHDCLLHRYRFQSINASGGMSEFIPSVRKYDPSILEILLSLSKYDHSSLVLLEYIDRVLDSDKSVGRYYIENWDRVKIAYGSKLKHQAWEGGYVDHILQMLFLLEAQIFNGFIKEYDRAYLATTILLHDIEKVFRDDPTFDKYHTIYTLIKEDPAYEYISPTYNEDYIQFHSSDETTYRILHDIKHAHGELDSHNPITRVLSPSGAYLHSFDIISARAHYNMNYKQFINKFGSNFKHLIDSQK